MEGRAGRAAWLGLVLAVCLGYAASGSRPSQRVAVIALDASQASALCAAAGYPAADFWERARTIGVGAALFREETLSDLSARGDVLSFSREELEKWKALGLVAPSVTLEANTLWIKDSKVLARLLSAAERTGSALSTGSAAGYHILEFKEGSDPSFPAGYDLEKLSLVQSQGLVPILGGAAGEDLSEVGLRWQSDGQIEGYPSPEDKPLQEVLSGRVLGVQARLPAVLRAVYSHPRRLILLRLDPAVGVEKNLSDLRGLLKPLRDRGVSLSPPARPPESAPRPRAWRLWLAWLLAALGPLLAVRAGLDAFKGIRSSVLRRWPIVSPVPEVAGGVLFACAAAAALGLSVSLILGPDHAAGLPPALADLAVVLPLAAGLLALFPMDWKAWRRRWRAPLAIRDAAMVLLAAAAALLFFKPRVLLGAAGLWDWAQRAGESSTLLWWWRWRWREIVVGYPALLHAFFLLERKLGCPDCPGAKPEEPLSDPRGWLVVGLLGPAGVVAALGHPGAPVALVAVQTAEALLLGLLFGAALIALRGPALRWALGPTTPRPIDPEKPI